MKLLRLIVRAMADAGLRLESWSYAIDKKMKLGIWKKVEPRITAEDFRVVYEAVRRFKSNAKERE